MLNSYCFTLVISLQDEVPGCSYLDPNAKEVAFNPRYEDMYRPEVGHPLIDILIFVI